MSSIPENVRPQVSLRNMTSWQIGGPAEFFTEPKSLDELIAAVKWATDEKHKITILGGGSNVLISDDGVRGLVICLGGLTGIEVHESSEDIVMDCWAGTPKTEVLKQLLKYKLEAAMFLAGIPGHVGGGIAMNAGIGEKLSPREFVEIAYWIEVLKIDTVQVRRYQSHEFKWGYRKCTGWQPGIITRVGLKFPNQPHPQILQQVRSVNLKRAQNQPLELPSCGSVFVNPPENKAGRLLESAGLKGFTIGGAQISMKHANFIVNTGTATAADVKAVIEHARAAVLKRSGIDLKTEVVELS